MFENGLYREMDWGKKFGGVEVFQECWIIERKREKYRASPWSNTYNYTFDVTELKNYLYLG